MYTDLTLIVFGPLILGLGLFFPRPGDRRSLFEWAVGASGVPFLYSLTLLRTFDPLGPEFQSMTPEGLRNWIVILDRIRIEYLLGIDGISFLLVLLTTFLTPVAILGATTSVRKQFRGYLFSILALETCVLGCLTALDMFLFYMFWILSLLPIFFIIGIWGSTERIRTAVKFLIYSMVGSVLMLAAILALQSFSSSQTFNYTGLLTDQNILNLGRDAQAWLFWGFFLAFAIRTPVFPFHTWLPDADSEAPPGGSVLINALMLNVGAYGMIRFCLPLFPDAVHQSAPLICILGTIGIIYGAWVASAQLDFRRFIAYFSISQMGLIIIGIFVFSSDGITGAVLHMTNHSLFVAGLVFVAEFLIVRRGTTHIAQFGGIIKTMPMMGAMFFIIAAAAMGIPGLNGFVSSFLLFLGIFESGMKGDFLNLTLGAFAVTGMIWVAVSVLGVYHKIMLGKITLPDNRILRDLNPRETTAFVILILVIVLIGMRSWPLTSRMDTSVQRILVQSASEVVAPAEIPEIPDTQLPIPEIERPERAVTSPPDETDTTEPEREGWWNIRR